MSTKVLLLAVILFIPALLGAENKAPRKTPTGDGSVAEAIRFERYKAAAAERQARIEQQNSSASRSVAERGAAQRRFRKKEAAPRGQAHVK